MFSAVARDKVDENKYSKLLRFHQSKQGKHITFNMMVALSGFFCSQKQNSLSEPFTSVVSI